MAEYRPELPEDMKGLSINTSHADYKALEALAREEGWTQKSFSRVLGLEAKRVMARGASPSPAPPPVAKPDYAKMSPRRKNSPTRSRTARGEGR